MNGFLFDALLFGLLAVMIGTLAVLSWMAKSYAAAGIYTLLALVFGLFATLALGLWCETREGKEKGGDA